MKKYIKYLLEKIGLKQKFHTPLTSDFVYRLDYFLRLWPRVEGEIVECGVGSGKTFLALAHILNLKKENRILYGFDTFEGLPEPTKEDVSFRNPKKGELKTKKDWIWTIIKGSQLSTQNIKLTKGYFKDIKFNKPIALLHIDGDLYQSYKDALTILFPLVAKGGVIIFDEYNEPAWPGATKAVNEFFDKDIQKDLSGKYFIVKMENKIL